MTKVFKNNRLVSLDLMRGYFLAVIIIDHLGRFPGVFELFTGQGKLWVSAAEGFFMISGLLIGIIYKRKLQEKGWRYITKKLWSRALKLYVISVVLTLLFTLWGKFLADDVRLHWGIWSGDSNFQLILRTLTFRYVYGWADYLPYYVSFVFFSPLVIYQLSKERWLIIVLTIFILWLIRANSSYLAWQVVFNLSVIGGYYFDAISGFIIKHQKLFGTLFILTLVGSIFFVFGGKESPDMKIFFDKDTQGLGRIMLSFIWIPSLYVLFSKYEEKVNKLSKGVLKVLGQNSLFVYIAQAVIIFPINFIISPSQNGIGTNFLSTSSVLVTIYLVTWVWARSHPIHRIISTPKHGI